MALPPDEIISYERLEQALDRAMKASPPQGLERALSRDSNLLADVFLPMVLARGNGFVASLMEVEQFVVAGSMKPDQQEAFVRWSLDGPVVTETQAP